MFPHNFLLYAGKLKQTKRTGWLKYIPEDKVESVACHSFRVSLISLVLP